MSELMRATRHTAKRELQFLMSALLFAGFLWGLVPSVEGKIFPVTTSIKILDPITTGSWYMEFAYSYVKLRKNCRLVDISSTIGGDYVTFAPVSAPPPGPHPPRPPGYNVSSLFRLDAPSLDGLVVSFVHACPFEPWTVITRVYP